jgi:multiple sugar transport system substrate-binding protein
LQGRFAPATLEATRISGHLYGLPIAYYPWGLFYRRSLFRKLGLSPPATWSDFLHACDRLKAAGITPIGLAAGDGWPAAGWFDLLDLRMNGLDFHRRLLAGDISFRDPAARAVLTQWKALLDDHDFLDEALNRPWTDAMPYLYREKVGMVLMGSFIGARLPPDMAGDIGFLPFPAMSTAMADYEDAPLDVLMLPRTSRHHDIALRFLAFLAGGNELDRFNQIAHTFSPRLGAPLSADEVSRDEKRLLDGAAGLAFFFDRDASEPIMNSGLDAFRAFLAPPHDVDRTLGLIAPRLPGGAPH